MDWRPFEGELIRLRAREAEDEPLYHRWINDPEVTEFLATRYPLSHHQEREWVQSTGGPGFSYAGFAVETRAESRLIGSADLRVDRPEDRCASLGIAIGDKTAWDRGYGTDTMRTLCRFGFEEMNLHRIQLDVWAGNLRARKVYDRVGFREEGVLRQANFRGGRYHDIVIMGLLQGELR